VVDPESSMGLWQAAAWGVVGGGAVVALNFAGDLLNSRFRWPWLRDEVGPRLVYAMIQLVLGGIVTAANHSQVTGAWPAFIIGISAPAVVQGIVARVEVTHSGSPTKTGGGPLAETEGMKPLDSTSGDDHDR
jgi:hypothetical protein